MKNRVRVLVLGLCLCASTAFGSPIMYVHDSRGELATVDVASGNVTLIGNMGHVMTDIAFDPSGNLYGVTFTQFYAIDATTAASTLIGNLGLSGANALVFASDGTLYTAGFNTTGLFTVNPGTGAASLVGSMGFASGGDLAFNGGDFYLASSSNQLVRVNPTTGAGTLVGSFGIGNVFGLATGDNGVLYGVAGETVYTIDTTTGAATTPVSYSGQGLGAAYGQSFHSEAGADPVATPEPGTLMLLGTGVAAAWRARRRRGESQAR